jgi:hypothetical protein
MKKFIILLLAIIASGGKAVAAPVYPASPAGVTYERDGHYWTVRLMSYLISKDSSEARQLAYYAEWPDATSDEFGNMVYPRSTWLWPWRQALWHALTGRSAKKTRAVSMRRVKKETDYKKKGIALHRLGDSYAHAMKKDKVMFPLFIGHALRGHYPDKIANFPEKYLRYVDSLAVVLGGNPATLDLTAFKYVAQHKFDTKSNEEILKSELYIHSGVNEYIIDLDQQKTVADFLDTRKGVMNFTYSIEVKNIGTGKSSKKGRKYKATKDVAFVTLTRK